MSALVENISQTLFPSVKLSDVAAVEKIKHKGESPYVGLEDISNASGEFLGTYEPRTMKSTTFRFNEGHVLYGQLRPYLNKALLPDFEGHCSSEIFPILPSEDLDRRYLFYWLTSPETCSRISATETGARMPRANMKDVLAFKIPLPPLDEQKRIVAVLDQAFAALDRTYAHAEANLEDAEELFENSLTELFEALSKQVAPTPLAKAVHPDCKISYGIVQPGSETPKGLPVVRPVDLKQRLIVADGLKHIAPERASGYARTKLRGGELLLCVRGSVGELAVASEELADANVTRGIVPIRFDEKEVLPEFGYFQLRSRYARDQLLAKTYGAALTQINIKDLRCLSFLAPTLHIQQEIVRKIEHIYERSEQLKISAAGKLRTLEELRRSLLRSAFAGELV